MYVRYPIFMKWSDAFLYFHFWRFIYVFQLFCFQQVLSFCLCFVYFHTIVYFFCQYNYKMFPLNIFVLIYPVFQKRKFEFLVFPHHTFSDSFIFPCTEVIKSNRFMCGSRPIKFVVSWNFDNEWNDKLNI